MQSLTASMEAIMPILTVRNVPDDVHRALRVRAAQNGRSTEAEVREILASAVMPQKRVRLGDALAMLGREIGLSNADVEAIEQGKDKAAAEPVRFE
ncbi:plasmid stability protein StbC [Cupriavidus necator N-1]|uniref:Plasmid stability protein StbC n=2 Tax=Burkholderiaceae TaxID=119060 RepID=F8GRR0_CUPNN|nr:plasmid stability protein StbC [Cupriavidus necator N-1]